MLPVSLKVGRGEVQGVFNIDGALLTKRGGRSVTIPQVQLHERVLKERRASSRRQEMQACFCLGLVS